MKRLYFGLLLLLPWYPLAGQPYHVSGIIINELYYDVGPNYNGNWNGGGSNINEDQFIELYNDSDVDVNLASWVICDANSFYFIFKSDTLILPARRSLVLAKVIGSHTPPVGHLALTLNNAGSVIGSWGFSTSGDCIFLINPGPNHGVGGPDPDDEWMTFGYEGATDASTTYQGRVPNGTKIGFESDNKNCQAESINRNPDITGATWEKHLVLSSSNACSPNQKVGNNGPLPVNFLSFRANVKSDLRVVRLTWTSDEANCLGYEIERRPASGLPWQTRGFQPSRCSDRCVNDYAFEDPYSSEDARLYYRLRQRDVGGESSDGPTVSVDVAEATGFTMTSYPNPFGTALPAGGAVVTILLDGLDAESASPVTVDVVDRLGRSVDFLYSGVPRESSLALRFDAAGLPSGVYYCRMRTKNREVVRPLYYLR